MASVSLPPTERSMNALWSRLELLLAGRVWIVLVVAVIIVIPTIVLGEVAANDARQRVREAQLQAQMAATERAAGRASVVLASYADGLVAAVKPIQTSRGSADAPIVRATRSGDPASMREALGDIAPRLLYSGNLLLVDARGIIVAGLRSGNLGTQQVQVIGLEANNLFFLDIPGSRLGAVFLPPDELTRAFGGPAVYLSDLYEPFDREGHLMTAGSLTQAWRPGTWPGPRVAIGVRILGQDGRLVGALVAETFEGAIADATFEITGTAEEIYLVDRNGRLVKRRRLLHDPEYFRDLSAKPVVRTVLGGGTVRGDAEDPLGLGLRLMTSARTPDVAGVASADLVTGWHMISAQRLDRVFGDLEGSMATLRAIRVALVIVILGFAVVLTIAMRRTVRQRRALPRSRRRAGVSSTQSRRTPLTAIIGFESRLRSAWRAGRSPLPALARGHRPRPHGCDPRGVSALITA